MGILRLYSQNMLVEISGNCSGGWSQLVSLLRGNSEGSAGQFEPAENLTRCWCSTVEFTKQYVLLSFKKMLIASGDIVNLPNKKETTLPKQ